MSTANHNLELGGLVTEAALDPVMILSPLGRILYVNAAGMKLLSSMDIDINDRVPLDIWRKSIATLKQGTISNIIGGIYYNWFVKPLANRCYYLKVLDVKPLHDDIP